MPKGPQGQKRPADAIGCAVSVARIATGEQEDAALSTPGRRKSGVAGAKARSESLTDERKAEIAAKASAARWKREGNMSDQSALVGKMFEGDSKFTNVKLYPGTSNDTTATKVGEQVRRVFAEIENDALEVIELDD